jgi:hypothetical protein
MVFKGTIGTGGTVTILPDIHTIGNTYKVITAGTYAGQVCAVGDMIICVVTGTTDNNSDWTVVQTNETGVVTGPSGSVDTHVAVFDGTTGKILKDSGFTLGISVPSGAVFTDTKVINTLATTTKAYITGTTTATTNTGTQVFDTGVYLGTTAGSLYATTFTGKLIGNSSTSDKLNNSLALKINSGTTEGTDLYTFNGSTAKVLNIIAGANISLTAGTNILTINAVHPTATETTSGIVQLATTTEATTGTDTTKAVTAAGVKAAIDVALTLKAPLASPTFTGDVIVPDQTAGNNSTKAANTKYVDAKVAESITDGVTGIAPSQDVVFDALALKTDLTYAEYLMMEGDPA